MNLQPTEDPTVLTMDLVRLEQLDTALHWQQRRFDSYAQAQRADGTQVNVSNPAQLRQLLADSGASRND